MSEMVTWSAKIDEATKAKLVECQRSCGGANEMLQNLIEAYDLQMIRGTAVDIPGFRDLKHHLDRSEEIFVESLKCARDRELENSSRIIQLETELKDARLAAQEAKDTLGQVIASSEESVSKANESLAKEKEAHDEAVRIQSTLQRALENANDKVAELEAKTNQTDQTLAKLRDCESRLEAANHKAQELQTQSEKLGQLEAEFVSMKNERDQLQKAVDRFPLEKQEAELSIEKRMLGDFYALKDELASAREQLARVEME